MSDSTTITPAQFRIDFTAFQDVGAYPDVTVSMYLNLATSMLSPQRWGQLWKLGCELWAAHFLTLDWQATRVAAAGGSPGTSGGMVTSKGVGPASVSFDVSSALEEGGGMWNLTTYGLRWLRFAKMIGAAGDQFGGTFLNTVGSFEFVSQAGGIGPI